MKFSLLWKVLLILFGVSVAIFLITENWKFILFTFTFGGLYGGTVYTYRHRIGMFFEKHGLRNFPVFIFLSILVSVLEELYVYVLGIRTAVPDIWIDIIVVPGEWAVWFATWYLILSRRYRFTAGQALFAAGLEGIMYEYVGNGIFLRNPVGVLLSIPGTVIVYAAIFILPMQLISFTGTSESIWKYPVSVFLPFVLTIPVALLLYAVFV